MRVQLAAAGMATAFVIGFGALLGGWAGALALGWAWLLAASAFGLAGLAIRAPRRRGRRLRDQPGRDRGRPGGRGEE